MGTLAQYRNMLRINKHRLDEELEIHAQVLDEIGRHAAGMERNLARIEAEHDGIIAGFNRRCRVNDPKISVAALLDENALDRTCGASAAALADAKQVSAEWAALHKAWYQRGFDLKALGELFIAQYFGLDSIGMAQDGPNRNVDVTARAAIREASRTADQFSRIGAGAGGDEARPRRRVME